MCTVTVARKRTNMAIPRVIVAFLLLGVLVAPPRAVGKTLNGHWWARLSPREKRSALAGYADCYSSDVKSDGDFDQASPSTLDAVDRYYTTPKHMGDQIVGIFRRYIDLDAAKFKSAGAGAHDGGERWIDKHGYYNGDYWHELDPDQRVAFVSGYVICEEHYIGATVHPSALFLEHSISSWFGTSDTDVSALNARRADDKIGNVLVKALRRRLR